ncbi:MAG: amidohydrolase family protein [Chloroflexi bacterium]|nr:amidohydrolase family protein [Chloroflexota bacterium]
MRWDLLIKGGRVIDPANGIDDVRDVAISGKVVETVAGNLPADQATTVVDATGKIVTPGFIDLHVHNFVSAGGRPSVDSDTTNLAFGVTTALDAGTATPAQYPHYWETDIASTKVRLYSLVRMPDPYGPDPATVAEVKDLITSYDTLLGVKFHHSQHFTSLPLAREAADFGGGMLMCEAYGAPIPQLLDWMNPGDILTHTFHAAFRFPIFDHRGKVWQHLWDAKERGVYLDIGHGARGFAFRTMEQALEQGLKPDTISTDVHVGNVDGPVYDMPTTMSKMLALGIPISEVIDMSTRIPARALSQERELGSLSAGTVADVVVSRVDEGKFKYLDVLHEVRNADQRIVPETVVYSGQIYDGGRYSPVEMSHQHDAPPDFIVNET